MLRSTLLALLVLLLGSPVPAAAQPDDSAFLRSMREWAEATSGVPVGNGTPADKIIFFGRNRGGELVVATIAALAPGGAWGDPAEGAVAALRTRAAASPAPYPDDLAFAARSGIPVFIVGEWQTPPMVWEVRRQGTGAHYREVGAGGAPGPWRSPAL
ncbi:hypothetical protein [Allosphingosinicella sp.]|jgi:hypothetical protein|uniref:hypothetical protein n=1 Tax=Allosphingosinicella sp. TaxID=2823234 RepID=UPI002F021213